MLPPGARIVSDPIAETVELASRRHPSGGGWPHLVNETRTITIEGQTRHVRICVTASDAPEQGMPDDLGLHLAAQIAASWPSEPAVAGVRR